MVLTEERELTEIRFWHNWRLTDTQNYQGSLSDRISTLRWQMKFGLKGLKNIKKLVEFVLARSKNIYEADVDWCLDLETEYFGEFVRRECGENVLEYFAQPMVSAITFTHPKRIGLTFGLQIMWTILCGEAAVLRQGIGSLAEKLVAECSGEGGIMTGTPVKRIVLENRKVNGVESDKGFFEADTVICAATATRTLDMGPDLPEPMRQALSGVVYAPTINVAVAVDKVMSENGCGGGVLPRKAGYPICSIAFNSARSKTLVPEGCDSINCFLCGDDSLEIMKRSDGEIADTAVRYLKELLPRMSKHVLFSKVARWPEANYLMPPGCCTAVKYMRDNHYRDVESLFLCGEYMYTGSCESALASGVAAAEAAMGKRQTI